MHPAIQYLAAFCSTTSHFSPVALGLRKVSTVSGEACFSFFCTEIFWESAVMCPYLCKLTICLSAFIAWNSSLCLCRNWNLVKLCVCLLFCSRPGLGEPSRYCFLPPGSSSQGLPCTILFSQQLWFQRPLAAASNWPTGGRDYAGFSPMCCPAQDFSLPLKIMEGLSAAVPALQFLQCCHGVWVFLCFFPAPGMHIPMEISTAPSCNSHRYWPTTWHWLQHSLWMLELLMLLGSSKAAMFQQRRTSSQHQAQPSKASSTVGTVGVLCRLLLWCEKLFLPSQNYCLCNFLMCYSCF